MLMAAGGVESTERKRDVITRNFLGGCPVTEISHEDLDLSLEVKSGWKTQLPNMKVNHTMGTTTVQLKPKQQQQQQEPIPIITTPLDMKLHTLNTYKTSTPAYQSVCTLEKVKSALERAKQDINVTNQFRQKKLHQQPDVHLHVGSPTSSSSSSSITTSSCSIKRNSMEGEEDGGCSQSSGSLLAAGCPSCLMYVLIAKSNPKCPRCEAQVPLPQLVKIKANKKPRIDLNFALN